MYIKLLNPTNLFSSNFFIYFFVFITFFNFYLIITFSCLIHKDGFPIRIKAVNIINEPRIFKGIFAIIKPFLKEKMAERVSITLVKSNQSTKTFPFIYSAFDNSMSILIVTVKTF